MRPGSGPRGAAQIALLLDEMHAPAFAEALQERGHDVVAVAERPDLRAMADADLFVWASRESRRLVTENVKTSTRPAVRPDRRRIVSHSAAERGRATRGTTGEDGRPAMTKFRIQKHGRLQELIAHQNGYFRDEGLDYEFGAFVSGDVMGPIVDQLKPVHADGTPAVPGTVDVTTGMFETYAAGRACDVSSACHWAINEAATARYGRMWGRAYSVTPGAIMVPPESPARKPADLAGVEVAVGYHSGSHFSALQALESFLPAEDIRLRFVGLPWDRVEALLRRTVPAASIWGVPLYLLDQQGFRRVADTTFMIGFLFDASADPADVERYFRALQRAQADIDVEPERYKHHHLDEIPEHLRELADVRGFGMGERIVFLPYTRDMYERSQRWIHERRLFDGERPTPAYEAVVFA